jgi:cation diffusion facilitator CzcD-associated flavoprotein CzcO
VLGTGASAIQFVPKIQPHVASLAVFQRTPPWILPKPDRGYGGRHGARLERFPLLQLAERFGWWGLLEAAIAGFVGHDRVLAPLAGASNLQRRIQVRDPELRAKLTPRYRLGCKRILLSTNWYPALAAPNAEVVTDRVREASATGLVLENGREVPLDVLIFGTGFKARTFVAPMEIRGRGGVTLDEVWAGVPHAWHGLSVPGFPNAFLVYGPNTYGGSGSAIYMLESQMRHVVAGAEALRRAGGTIELREAAHDAFVRDLRERQKTTVWATGGCTSWYVDAEGRDPTNWPGYTWDYRRRTADIDPEVYALSPAV